MLSVSLQVATVIVATAHITVKHGLFKCICQVVTPTNTFLNLSSSFLFQHFVTCKPPFAPVANINNIKLWASFSHLYASVTKQY